MKRICQSWSAWLLAGTLSASGGIALGQTATPLPTVAPKIEYSTPVPTKSLKALTPTPTTPPLSLPGPPTGVSAVQGLAGSTKVMVRWTPPTTGLPILSYTVKRFTNLQNDSSTTVAGTVTSTTHACVAIGVPCGYAVSATNAAGSSKNSALVTVTLK